MIKKTDNKKNPRLPVSKSTKPNRHGLNPRQEIFAQEVAKGLTAADAYRIAYGQGNYSDECLYKKASELKGKVRGRIEMLLAERARKTEKIKDECTGILLDIARANAADSMYADPKTGKQRMRTPQQLGRSLANAISRMTNNNGKVDYQFHGKVEAIKLLAQINGWLEPTEVNVKNAVGFLGELRIGFDDEE